MDLPGEQVDARHQGDCSVPLVLVIASDRRMSCGNRRQIGSRRADRLDAWFLVVRDDRDRRSRAAYGVSVRGFFTWLETSPRSSKTKPPRWRK